MMTATSAHNLDRNRSHFKVGDRAASAALAKEILDNVTGKLTTTSPFLVQVRDLAAQQL